MGLFGDFISDVCGFVGNAFSTFCDGVSLVVDSFSGLARTIGDGIKEICDKVGTEGMLLTGSIALALIIPGFGLPEILSLIQIVGKVANMLNVGGKDSPEEIGMKSEIADKKPDNFETIEEYLKYLNEEVELDREATENLSPEERAKYGLIGAAFDIRAIQEKYKVELSPDFLRDVTLMRMPGEEVGNYVKGFAEKGITKMQDMTDYLRGESINTDKSEVCSSIMDTMKTSYPELTSNQLYSKLDKMEAELKNIDI